MATTTSASVASLLLMLLVSSSSSVSAARDLLDHGRKLAQGQSAEHVPKLVHFMNPDKPGGGPPDTPQPDWTLLADLKGNPYAGKGGTGTASTTSISYHNGPVMKGGVSLYVIWYGNWATTTLTSGQGILRTLLAGLNNSAWYNINTQYTDTTGKAVASNITLKAESTVAYPYGTSLSDSQIGQVVRDYLSTHTADAKGIYLVLTSPDVTASSGFCTNYCGWHTRATINSVDVKYAFIGNAITKCPASCSMLTSAQDPSGADGMASVIAHEIAEAATDPDLNAWYDSNGQENADKCAWTFGTTYTVTGTTRKANMKLGGRDFLIQQNWVRLANACKLAI